jgi:hypothetical protein
MQRQDSPETKPTPETDVQDRWIRMPLIRHWFEYSTDSVWFALIRFVSEGQGTLGMLGMLIQDLAEFHLPKAQTAFGAKIRAAARMAKAAVLPEKAKVGGPGCVPLTR